MKELLDKDEFVHFRAFNKKTGDLLPRGGATFYYSPVDIGVVAIGVALCSFKDNFNLKIGRAISRGRTRRLLMDRLNRDELMVRAKETVEEAFTKLGKSLAVPADTEVLIVRRPKKKAKKK